MSNAEILLLFVEANAEDRALATKLISIVVDDETHRGKCSVWQLERFLSLHSHPTVDRSLEATLDNAAAGLVVQQEANPYCPMTVYEWLVRFGDLLGGRQETAAAADALEENGWHTVNELLAAKPEIDKLKQAGVGEKQAEFIATVVKWDEDRPDVLRGLCLPDRWRVLHELLLAFPGETDEAIRVLTQAVCTTNGRGLVSLHQIAAFVSRYNNEQSQEHHEQVSSDWKGGGAAAALLDVQDELLGAARPPKVEPPPPPVEEPTFVSTWLADVGLPELHDMFEEQGITEESDLDQPLFNPGEMGRLTKTVGQQRRLVKALKVLHGKRDLHVNS